MSALQWVLKTAFFSALWCLSTGQMAWALQSDEVARPRKKPRPDQIKTKEPEQDQSWIDSNDQTIDDAIGKQFAELHLQDGSIIGGDVQVPEVHIDTEFGRLTVPVEKIVRLIPGLASNLELDSKIQDLMEQLKDENADSVQQAQKKLISMGPALRSVIRNYAQDFSGEEGSRKQISEVQKAYEQAVIEAEEDGRKPVAALIELDTIETSDFTIVGEIEEKEFEVQSRFGRLKVKLGDIKFANRKFDKSKEEIRRTLNVATDSFFQTKPVSTRIRLNKGDKVIIKAEGTMSWVNWNNSCTPDGLTNRGQWRTFNSGSLVARVGTDDSRCVGIGTKGSFVAKSNGVLYLGIAMRDSYASNGGYNWGGSYKVRIVVNPTR
ncbi:MAG: hypothetical protein AAF623_12030 [Planctomycetota bacterium]